METMNNIEWARIPGTNYAVSNDGQVRDAKGEKCRQFDDGGGLYLVRMKVNGLYHLNHVDLLVAEAFVDNPHGYAMIDHIDGNTHNNRADNLQWGLKFKAQKIKNDFLKKPKKKPLIHQYNEAGEEIGLYKTCYEAAMCTGVTRSNIYKALDKENRTAGGYIFKTK